MSSVVDVQNVSSAKFSVKIIPSLKTITFQGENCSLEQCYDLDLCIKNARNARSWQITKPEESQFSLTRARPGKEIGTPDNLLTPNKGRQNAQLGHPVSQETLRSPFVGIRVSQVHLRSPIVGIRVSQVCLRSPIVGTCLSQVHLRSPIVGIRVSQGHLRGPIVGIRVRTGNCGSCCAPDNPDPAFEPQSLWGWMLEPPRESETPADNHINCQINAPITKVGTGSRKPIFPSTQNLEDASIKKTSTSLPSRAKGSYRV